MTCQKCKCKKEPMLCTVGADGFAEVDSEDADELMASALIEVDTGFQLWLHVCRECNHIQDSGVEHWGKITNKSLNRDAKKHGNPLASAQEIELCGNTVNIHDLSYIVLNSDGTVIGYELSAQKHASRADRQSGELLGSKDFKCNGCQFGLCNR